MLSLSMTGKNSVVNDLLQRFFQKHQLQALQPDNKQQYRFYVDSVCIKIFIRESTLFIYTELGLREIDNEDVKTLMQQIYLDGFQTDTTVGLNSEKQLILYQHLGIESWHLEDLELSIETLVNQAEYYLDNFGYLPASGF